MCGNSIYFTKYSTSVAPESLDSRPCPKFLHNNLGLLQDQVVVITKSLDGLCSSNLRNFESQTKTLSEFLCLIEKTRSNFAGHMVFNTDPIHTRVTLFHLRPVLTRALTGNTSMSDCLERLYPPAGDE